MIEGDSSFRQISEWLSAFKDPVPDAELERFTYNLELAKEVASLLGRKISYPIESEHVEGYLREAEVSFLNTKSNEKQIVRVGVNMLTKRLDAKTDFYVHVLSDNLNLRFIHYIDDRFTIRINDKYDETILYEEEKPVLEMTESECYLEGAFVNYFLRNINSN